MRRRLLESAAKNGAHDGNGQLATLFELGELHDSRIDRVYWAVYECFPILSRIRRTVKLYSINMAVGNVYACRQ